VKKTSKKTRLLTGEQISKMKKMIRAGKKTEREIAEAVGCSRSTVWDYKQKI